MSEDSDEADMNEDGSSASVAASAEAAGEGSYPNEGIIPDIVISEALRQPVLVAAAALGTRGESPPTIIDLTLSDDESEVAGDDSDKANMSEDGDVESASFSAASEGGDSDQANMNEDGDVGSASFSAASEAAGGGSLPNEGVCCIRSKQSAMSYLLYYAISTLIYYRM